MSAMSLGRRSGARAVCLALVAAVAVGGVAPVAASDVIVDPGGGTRVDWPFRIRQFRIVALPQHSRPYANYPLQPLSPSYPQDSSGVIMYRFAGDGRLYYHPVQMAQMGLILVDNYRSSGIRAYLDRAVAIANRMRAEGVAARGGLYLPYRFPWVHGDDMGLPWYSGMAQGQALSFYIRLYGLRGRQVDLDTARLLYHTMTITDRSRRPWVSYIDGSGYLWYEEYPQATPDHVLNGFDFSIFGLYDYWLATRDTSVRTHLQAALTTVRAYVARYRVPGGISYYCLGHKVQMANYHALHIRQLRSLAAISSDPYFASMAETFFADYGGASASRSSTAYPFSQAVPVPADGP
jgi:D-glucuronyl C5-epimerase C-terminus